MSLLPQQLRFWLFDALSLKTMRYVDSVPRRQATGMVATIYRQIERDFFINGSLTSRSRVPELLAAIWAAGRETILVDDQLDRTTKEAMAATLSDINDCPYCGDMLVSLVHAGEQPQAAMLILARDEEQIADPLLRQRLAWVRAVTTPGAPPPTSVPFTAAQLPEAVGSLMAMGDINRFSHVVMDGSPVTAPLGLAAIKRWALRRFGDELRETHSAPLEPGQALRLVPFAELPEDMQWARNHPRIARALAGWTALIEREAAPAVPPAVQRRVDHSLSAWQGEPMPLSRSWVETEVEGLTPDEQAVARLALLLAKAPYQIDDAIVQQVIGEDPDPTRLVRILAWCSFTASRHIARRIARDARRALEASALAA